MLRVRARAMTPRRSYAEKAVLCRAPGGVIYGSSVARKMMRAMRQTGKRWLRARLLPLPRTMARRARVMMRTPGKDLGYRTTPRIFAIISFFVILFNEIQRVTSPSIRALFSFSRHATLHCRLMSDEELLATPPEHVRRQSPALLQAARLRPAKGRRHKAITLTPLYLSALFWHRHAEERIFTILMNCIPPSRAQKVGVWWCVWLVVVVWGVWGVGVWGCGGGG